MSAGGGAYSPALTDFVVMTEGSAMFLTGPGVVREVMGEDVDAAELGGPRVHSKNGVCQFVAQDDREAAALARQLLAFLPSHAGEHPPHGGPAAVYVRGGLVYRDGEVVGERGSGKFVGRSFTATEGLEVRV